MTTSLAQQLQKLAVPQTSRLLRDKERASLLFNPSEAAGLSKEIVYQLGLDGFEELKSKNPKFAIFENNLFHLSSKEFERTIQSAEANEKLDKTIRRFFIYLSPYFLLNCSHKALEWLVFRYYIHQYNKEDFLMLILPYHETNIFVRALQLIRIKSKENWRWLRPLQKPGIHLPKTTLYNHAASDPHFLQFISKNILVAISEYEKPSQLTVLFNFYCTVFTGALEHSKEIKETQISHIMHSLIKGLKSDIPDFCASSYIILSKLLTKTNLSDKILEKLVTRITQVSVLSLKSESLLCLVILYQSQDQYKDIPESAVSNLTERKWVPKMLQKLIDQGYLVKPFLSALLLRSLKMALEEVATDNAKIFVDSLLEHLTLAEITEELIKNALEIYDLEMMYEVETKKWLIKFMKTIELQCPNEFDKAISKVMKKSEDETAMKKQKVFEIIMEETASANHIVLFEKLYHPSKDIRKTAISSLMKKYDSLKDREKDFIKSAISDRLNDDETVVVLETLKISSKSLENIIGGNELKGILTKILSKQKYIKEMELLSVVLKMLCKIDTNADIEVFLAILPFLLPITERYFSLSQIVIESEYIESCGFLKGLKEQLKNADQHEKVFSIVIKFLTKKDFQIDSDILIDYFKNKILDNILQKYLAMVLLSHSVKSESPFLPTLQILEIFIKYLENSEVELVNSEASYNNYINLAYKMKLPLEGYLDCLNILILKSKKSSNRLSNNDFYEENYENKFILILYELLLKGIFASDTKIGKVYSNTLKIFLNHFCENLENKMEFFFNIISAESLHITPQMKLKTIKIANDILSNNNISDKLLNFKSSAVPCLLSGLNNNFTDIRATLLLTLNILIKGVGKATKNNFSLFIKGLISSSSEIATDKEQVPLVVKNILEEENCKNIGICLINFCRENNQIYLKSGLIKALSLHYDFKVLSRFFEIGSEILGEKMEKLNSQKAEIIFRIISLVNEALAVNIKIGGEIWKFLELALREDKCDIVGDDEKSACPSIMLMNKITREIFECFNNEVKKSILEIVLHMATTSNSPTLLSVASRLFKHIDLDACSISQQLIQMRDVNSPKMDEAKKKRRVSVVPTLDILDTLEWKKGVTILEFIQDKKKLRNVDKLLPILFEILKKCLDFDEQSGVEYPKQLILSSILHYCNKIEESNIPSSIFNMELVVQCIRASQNPQTHHHALLLLAQTASFIPDQVLHHIMAIFTFMGSSVLRHDDAYSFQIISKIIETVIPVLVKDGTKGSIMSILRVFVDVILDVPEHRRMPLYELFLNQIGTKDNLYVFILLIFEAHVTHANSEKQKTKDEVPKRLDIAADLCRSFSPEIVIFTCMELIKYLKLLPEDKENIRGNNLTELLLDIKRLTPKQFRHFKYTLVTFVSNLLSSKQFVTSIALLNEDDSLELESLFKETIINILTFVQTTSKIVDKNINTPQAQYWKVLLHYNYEILDCLNALLTPQMFLLVIKGLLSHNLSTVKRRALELFNSKLHNNQEFFNECDDEELYVMLPAVIKIIKGIEKENLDSDEEVIIQTALLTLKLCIRLLYDKNPDKFLQILNFITDIVKNKNNPNILASAILCLAELCSNLRAKAIPCLNQFMPALIKILKLQEKEETPTLLLLSAITALQKIIDCLAMFLSPYLGKLLVQLSKLGCTWGFSIETEDQKVSTFSTKLLNIKQKIGKTIPPRVLIPSIEETYDDLISKSEFRCVGPLMDILAECLSCLEGHEIQNTIPELTTFFLNALQFRSNGTSSYEEANEVESHVIKALNCLILKLSESTFRPLYYKLYDWAIRTNEGKSERAITFYALSHQVANSLKGLFVLFAGHFLNNAASILDSCNKNKRENLYFDSDNKNNLLLESTLKTLNFVCMYDSQKFINKERFDVLMQPIVDQIDNPLGDFEDRCRNLVIPSIVNFTVAAQDDALWKQLNYQVLLKMRDSNPTVRLLALECLKAIVQKTGEDFLPLLPETIPFLAELLEDEEENVEKACQKAVQEMEKVLGEPLQKYF